MSGDVTPTDLAALVKMRSGCLVSGVAAQRCIDKGLAEWHPTKPGLVRPTPKGLAALERSQ